MKTLTDTFEKDPTPYRTKNGISLDRRIELNTLMNQRLASAIDLQMQIFTEISRGVDKWLWFIEAQSQATK